MSDHAVVADTEADIFLAGQHFDLRKLRPDDLQRLVGRGVVVQDDLDCVVSFLRKHRIDALFNVFDAVVVRDADAYQGGGGARFAGKDFHCRRCHLCSSEFRECLAKELANDIYRELFGVNRSTTFAYFHQLVALVESPTDGVGKCLRVALRHE